MADDTQLLYLEPDDEVTSVVRRLREADAGRVVLVASGRTKATTSAVALRLLAQVAADEGREIALVADPGARALAAEAGIAAFASVADANVEGAVPAAPPPAARAPIHVVRGAGEPAAPDQPAAVAAAVAAVPLASRLDETQAVPAARAAPAAAPKPSTRAPQTTLHTTTFPPGGPERPSRGDRRPPGPAADGRRRIRHRPARRHRHDPSRPAGRGAGELLGAAAGPAVGHRATAVHQERRGNRPPHAAHGGHGRGDALQLFAEHGVRATGDAGVGRRRMSSSPRSRP